MCVSPGYVERANSLSTAMRNRLMSLQGAGTFDMKCRSDSRHSIFWHYWHPGSVTFWHMDSAKWKELVACADGNKIVGEILLLSLLICGAQEMDLHHRRHRDCAVGSRGFRNPTCKITASRHLHWANKTSARDFQTKYTSISFGTKITADTGLGHSTRLDFEESFPDEGRIPVHPR